MHVDSPRLRRFRSPWTLCRASSPCSTGTTPPPSPPLSTDIEKPRYFRNGKKRPNIASSPTETPRPRRPTASPPLEACLPRRARGPAAAKRPARRRSGKAATRFPRGYRKGSGLGPREGEEGREKFREELNETHQLFKDFVKRMRPSLDIEQVATGEHWYGQQAVEKGLVDEINTSDEVILSLMEGREVVNVRYMQRKRLIDRFTGSAAESADRLLLRWWQRGQKPLM